jgi:excisionase family DNA binding protein
MNADAQLTDELTNLATALGALLGPDLVTLLGDRAGQAAPRLVADLTDGDLGDEVAADLLAVLWPHGDPDLSWWRTPLGRAVAPHWAAHQDRSWTHAEAAEVLGVTRGTVAQLVARGDLARHADGGVQVTAVVARLIRLGERPGAR